VSSQVYGVSGSDPLTMTGACVVLALVAAIAGYIPARRATRVNPVLALRYE
jgi:ABC-type lipoprotein release transport system permease subunit